MFTIDSHPRICIIWFWCITFIPEYGFAQRHNISTMAIPIAYKIRTPGAQLCVKTQKDTVRLVLQTHSYRLQFMVLPGQGIDAILGMNWHYTTAPEWRCTIGRYRWIQRRTIGRYRSMPTLNCCRWKWRRDRVIATDILLATDSLTKCWSNTDQQADGI